MARAIAGSASARLRLKKPLPLVAWGFAWAILNTTPD
jgi:hypothetical protein